MTQYIRPSVLRALKAVRPRGVIASETTYLYEPSADLDRYELGSRLAADQKAMLENIQDMARRGKLRFLRD